jgi:DNA modification methylase
MSVKILVGDVRDKLREMPEESVHCVVTSPPYWGLRCYGVDGQIGQEPTLQEHVKVMVEVFREVRRVLRKDGTVWLNYGDSYATGSFTRQGNPRNVRQMSSGYKGQEWTQERPQHLLPDAPDGLKPKDLCMMPARVALALQADGWWLRSEIIWHKPNPMPESITDRPTSSHEKIYLLARSERYYFDAEAVREVDTMKPQQRLTPREANPNAKVHGQPIHRRPEGGTGGYYQSKKPDGWDTGLGAHGTVHRDGREKGEPAEIRAGRNIRNVWTIATAPFPGAHFATFPPALIEPCIKAGTSDKGCCPECGAPWVRESITTYENPGNRTTNGPRSTANRAQTAGFAQRLEKRVETTGWRQSCDHGLAEVPCTVLDPFGGAGTTGLVADRLKRNAILIELNPEYAVMAERRIAKDAGIFGEVEINFSEN